MCRAHCAFTSVRLHRCLCRVIFKPGLLGVLTVMRMQEKLKADERYSRFSHVFYNEADQVVHTRLSVSGASFYKRGPLFDSPQTLCVKIPFVSPPYGTPPPPPPFCQVAQLIAATLPRDKAARSPATLARQRSMAPGKTAEPKGGGWPHP